MCTFAICLLSLMIDCSFSLSFRSRQLWAKKVYDRPWKLLQTHSDNSWQPTQSCAQGIRLYIMLSTLSRVHKRHPTSPGNKAVPIIVPSFWTQKRGKELADQVKTHSRGSSSYLKPSPMASKLTWDLPCASSTNHIHLGRIFNSVDLIQICSISSFKICILFN